MKMKTGHSCEVCSRVQQAPAVQGFTLLELVIVMLIMGFVLAFAGPRVGKGLLGLTIKTTTNKIAGALRYARSQAVNGGCPYHVVFDAEKQRLIVLRARQHLAASDDMLLPAADAAAEHEPEGPDRTAAADIKTYDLPEGILFGKIEIDDAGGDEAQMDHIYQMTFFPDGTAQQAEVALTDSDERVYHIYVDFITGAVSVAESEE